MDEQGEDEDGSRLPTWGGHLWRMRLPERTWEHLHATPEALIAVAGSGRHVYALGYFGHVVYHFDCATEAVDSIRVGAVEGHVSRNFVADRRGHVYVPRLRYDNSAKARATLVELDPKLAEIAETPLEHYLSKGPTESHGIVAYQPLADGSIAFATDVGFLYRIVPPSESAVADRGAAAIEPAPAKIESVSWLHPEGESYASSMFTYDGERYLASIAVRSKNSGFEWVVRDMLLELASTRPLNVPGPDGQPAETTRLYGSVTRDDQGNFYVVGGYRRRLGRTLPNGRPALEDGTQPLLVRLRPPR